MIPYNNQSDLYSMYKIKAQTHSYPEIFNLRTSFHPKTIWGY